MEKAGKSLRLQRRLARPRSKLSYLCSFSLRLELALCISSFQLASTSNVSLISSVIPSVMQFSIVEYASMHTPTEFNPMPMDVCM